MIKTMKYFMAAVCLLSAGFAATPGLAQEGQPSPISTERPTVGNSPDLIPPGSLQVENGAGVSFQQSKFAADLPESLLRLGLSERAEVRFQFSEEVYERSSEPHVASLQDTDPSLSLKVGIGKANQAVPRSGILALSFPRGGSNWTSSSYDPSVTAIWTQTVGTKYFVNEVAGTTLTTLSGARRACWFPSVAAGRSLSKYVSAFGEYAPTVLSSGNWEYVVDGGFALIHKELTQFDVRGGYLRDDSGYHTLLTIGYSVRRDGFLPRFDRLMRR